MHPTHIVIVTNTKETYATIAFSKEEAEKIASNWKYDGVFVEIVEVDYSMRNE